MRKADLERELAEARERETALAGVLAVMSRTPPDRQAVLDAIAENAARFCGAEDAVVMLAADGELQLVAESGPIPTQRPFSYPIDRQSMNGRAYIDRTTMSVPDIQAETAEYPRGAQHGARYGWRSALVTPLVRGDEAIGTIALRRTEVRPFTDHQIDLLKTFAAQAVIAIENERLFTETTDALERQIAVSHVLEALSQATTDLDVVFRTIAQKVVQLGRADNASIFAVQGDHYRHVASATDSGRIADANTFERVVRESLPLVKDRTSLVGRVLQEKATVQIPDIEADPEYDKARNAPFVVALAGGPCRAILGVPIVRGAKLVGIMVARREECRGFNAREIDVLETFARQAAIAIENTRLFNETKEALERQTAVAEILRVISRSPSTIESVLQAIAESAARYCGANDVLVMVADGARMRPASHAGPLDPGSGWHPIDRTTVPGRAIADGEVVYVTDLTKVGDDLERGAEIARRYGIRCGLAVPLMREGQAVGAIFLRATEPEAFTERQIELMRTFADQAVIAIENVRLFNETREALERQTATAEVLRAITESPSDLQPVFDSIAEHARVLCEAERVHLWLRNGDRFELAATGRDPALDVDLIRVRSLPIDRSNLAGRAILGRTTVHVTDVLTDPEYDPSIQQGAQPWHTVLAVPLMRAEEGIGAIALLRGTVRPFEPRQIELVQTFADQAAIAIENVRLFNETKEALDRETATAEVLRVTAQSTFEIQPVLDAVIRNATRLAGAENGFVYELDGGILRMTAAVGAKAETMREWQRTNPIRADNVGTSTGRAFATGATVHIADVLADPTYTYWDAQKLGGFRTLLSVPLKRRGTTVGVIAMWRTEPREFSEKEIKLVETFADQAAIAMENIRLASETKEALDQQTAVAEVLKVISRSAFDLKPVLSTVIESAARLCESDLGWVRTIEGDMTQRIALAVGLAASWARTDELRRRFDAVESAATDDKAFSMEDPVDFLAIKQPGTGPSLLGRTFREKHTIHIADITKDPELLAASGAVRLTESRTVLGVPMLQAGEALGVIVLTRVRVRPFAEREVRLVETFADQAAIAIQNVKLFNEIQEKSRQLEVASRHKSQFLATMSHELRTPLNAIIGFSEALLQQMFGPLNDKQSEYLQDVLSSGRHLLTLINDILDLSKIEAGRMELDIDRFSLVEALQNGITMVRERAARHGIRLSLDVDPGVDLVDADPRKVKQVLFNLLSNAVKFTPDGGSVDVSARRADGEVVVTVRDTGIGIAPEDQERIFEEFQQARRHSERSREGTGLGLALARRFVELHGGRLWVESAIGRGSAFTFTLPIRAPAAVIA